MLPFTPSALTQEMQQAMVSSIKAQKYEDALSIADQILKSQPNNIIVTELRKTLAEKLSLDKNVESDDKGKEDSSSNTESSSDQEQTSDSEVRTEQAPIHVAQLMP
ncbi:hypothetical protein WJX79_004704 [Trebouxia sp. C0005]